MRTGLFCFIILLTNICSVCALQAQNLIANPSFEQMNESWSVWPNANISTSKAHEGTHSLQSKMRGLNGATGASNASISVSKNTYYEYSAWIYRNDNSAWAYIDMNDAPGELQLRASKFGQWEKVSGLWYSGETTSVSLRCIVERDWQNNSSSYGGVTGDVWFDEIYFAKLGREPYNESTSELTPNALYWTIENDDIRAVIAEDESKVYICNLVNKKNTAAWISEPTILPILNRVSGNNINWQYSSVEKQDNLLSLKFISGQLSLKYVFELQPQGPMSIYQVLCNNTGGDIEILSDDICSADIQFDTSKPATVYRFNRSRFNNGLDALFTTGVLVENISTDFFQLTMVENSWLVSSGMLPFKIVHNGDEGLYLGYDWNYGHLLLRTQSNANHIRFCANLGVSSETIVRKNGSEWRMPGVFIGVYNGTVDDGANSMKRWFWKNFVPSNLRKNQQEPLIEIHFPAYSENDYRYYLNKYDLASLGVGLVKMDYWWTVPTTGSDPNSGFDSYLETQWLPNAQKWPNGMLFGIMTKDKYPTVQNSLYMCDTYQGCDISTKAGRDAQIAALSERITNWKIDYWRSDFDLEIPNNYMSHEGLLLIIDSLSNKHSNFRYEHCSAGGSLKDFSSLRRMAFMTMEDSGGPLNHRMAFYSNSYMINPVQLKFDVGFDWSSPSDATNISANPTQWSYYVLRSSMMGAMMACAVGRDMSSIEFEAAQNCWRLYNNKQRNILRGADVYHILPMPDGKHWDGIQFYNPEIAKGSVFLFSHLSNGGNDGTQKRIYLSGLDKNASYQLSFEDRTGLNCVRSGSDLMQNGILVTGMSKAFDSEIIWIEQLSSSVDATQSEGMCLYPNPVAAGQNVKVLGTDLESCTIKIFDMSGRLIETGITLNSLGFSAPQMQGCYLININGTTQKLIVR